MVEREGETYINPTERTIPVDPDRTLSSPRFDEKSIQVAQPAVPLTHIGRERRAWSKSVIIISIVAALIGGVLGGLALTFYKGDGARAETSQAEQTQTEAPLETAPDVIGVDVPNAQVETATKRDAQEVKLETAQPEQPEEADARGSKDADAATRSELQSALEGWLAATNARDVGRQMRFYAPTVNVFYLAHNASRESVRAEKARLFAGARSVDVSASSAPDIRLSGDGQTAVMRFRKRYDISGGEGASRRGEVLQELRWRRTASGWRIVSERDLRVLQ